MFDTVRRRFGDAKTLKTLCLEAERHARAEGRPDPGAEHFLLAALELPDGTARRVFERLGADPSALRAAIDRQYREALAGVGVEASLLDGEPEPALPPPPPSLYRASPSGQVVVQALARRREDGPLQGVHVLAVVAGMKQGVAVRALRAMGLEPERVAREAGTA